MYALSYRWWDTWKEYTERHSTTIEIKQQKEKTRNHLRHDPSISEDLRKCLLNLEFDLELDLDPEFRNEGQTNLNKFLEKEKWMQPDTVKSGEDVLELSQSMQ